MIGKNVDIGDLWSEFIIGGRLEACNSFMIVLAHGDDSRVDNFWRLDMSQHF